MIDFEYARYIAELLADENITENMFCLRFEAIRKLRQIDGQFGSIKIKSRPTMI